MQINKAISIQDPLLSRNLELQNDLLTKSNSDLIQKAQELSILASSLIQPNEEEKDEDIMNSLHRNLKTLISEKQTFENSLRQIELKYRWKPLPISTQPERMPKIEFSMSIDQLFDFD